MKVLEKGTLHNWYGTLREAMMRAKEDKPQVDTSQLVWDPEGGHDESKRG